MRSKIKSQAEISRIARALKRENKIVVTFNGSFDILHAGHVRALAAAKREGDVLIAAINSDASIRRYKGDKRPIISQKERAEMLAALECVDFVTVFDEDDPRRILAKIRPQVHCNGADWGRDCIERGTVEKYGGKIKIVKWHEGFSTTGLIERILLRYEKNTA